MPPVWHPDYGMMPFSFLDFVRRAGSEEMESYYHNGDVQVL